MRRLVASTLLLTLALAAPPGAEAKALTLQQLYEMGQWLDCVEACPPALPGSTYEAHVARQICLAECGVAPRQWEKNGYPPVDRRDHEVAYIEYLTHESASMSWVPVDVIGFCSADPDGNVLIPAALCPGEVCEQAMTCREAYCSKPPPEDPLECSWALGGGGHPSCYWDWHVRPPLCPAVKCAASPNGTAQECADEDGDMIPKWLEDHLGLDDQVPQPWCSSLHPCGFDQQCAPPPSTGDPAHTDPGPRCQPRPCPGGKCTAFHLELVAQDDVQAIVHVYYDYSPIPARVLDLHLSYNREALTLQDSRLLPTAAVHGKTLATSHLSDGTLRLSVLDKASSQPIPKGPIIELLFGRTGKGAARVAFATKDALQTKAIAPVQGAYDGVQQQLADDSLWGEAVALPARKDVPTTLRLWYGFDSLEQPLTYSNVPPVENKTMPDPDDPEAPPILVEEGLCDLWPRCANEEDEEERSHLLHQLNRLQAGRVSASDTVDGVAGQAAYLNGSHDHLRLPVCYDTPLSPGAQSYSFATWFYMEGNSEDELADSPQLLFSHNGFDERTHAGLILEPGEGETMDLSFFVGDVFSKTAKVLKAEVEKGIPLRTWHHVGFALDAAELEVDLYFDGVHVAEYVPPSTSDQPSAGATKVEPLRVVCPQFNNTVDVMLHEEGQTKGGLSGSTTPETLVLGVSQGPRYAVEEWDPSGTNPAVLIAAPDASFRDPDYSPVTERIVYAADVTGSFEIWLARSDGSDARQVTVGFGDAERGVLARRPRWAPDGSGIVFESNAHHVLAQDNTRARVFHLYYLPFALVEQPGSTGKTWAVAVPLADGSTTEQLDYEGRVLDGTINSHRITATKATGKCASGTCDEGLCDAAGACHTINARWLQGRSDDTEEAPLGRLVADRSSQHFIGHRVVEILIDDPVNLSTIRLVQGLAEEAGDEVRLVTARGYRQIGDEAKLVTEEWLLYEKGWDELRTVNLAAEQPTSQPFAKAGLFELVEDAAFSPVLPPRLLLGAISEARPVLLKTRSAITAAAADRIVTEPVRVRGISWMHTERLYPCNWIGGFQNPQSKLTEFGLRGALDDTRLWSGLRDPDAFRSEAERGREVLARDGKDKTLPSRLPTCTEGRHDECPYASLCLPNEKKTEFECRMVPCDPGAEKPCPEAGRCALRPVAVEQEHDRGHGGRSDFHWVCTADCETDQDCFSQQCLNGLCRFCDNGEGGTNTCIECRPFTEQIGAVTLSGIEGCPDQQSFYCEAGACLTQCYEFDDGFSAYRCDATLQYCKRGQCAAHDWTWWDLAPVSLGGLGEMRDSTGRDSPGLYTKAVDQRVPIEIHAYGVADLEEDPELLVEVSGGEYPKDPWTRIGRALVLAHTPAEAAQHPIVLDAPRRFKHLRIRLIQAPYSNLAGGSTGLGLKGKDLRADQPASSRAHLGYAATIPRWKAALDCGEQDRAGCPVLGTGAFEYLRAGAPAAILSNVLVDGAPVIDKKDANKICPYDGLAKTRPTQDGRERPMVFGPWESWKKTAEGRRWCASNLCPPSDGKGALVDAKHDFAVLNCPRYAPGEGSAPWADSNAEIAGVTFELGTVTAETSKSAGAIISDDGATCTVELSTFAVEPCYEWTGADASADPGNVAVPLGASVPFATLDFGLFRHFGHDEGFTPVVLPPFSLKATVTGLAAGGLKLRQGLEEVEVPWDGDTPDEAKTVTFPTELKEGRFYELEIAAQPNAKRHGCFVDPASALGTMTKGGLTVPVTCRTLYTISGGAVGADGALWLRLEHEGVAPTGSEEIEIVGTGPQSTTDFAFSSELPPGQAWRIAVTRAPPGQVCTVSAKGQGTLGAADVDDVTVTCVTTPTHRLGVQVTGLRGHGLELVEQGSHSYLSDVSSSGLHWFPTELEGGVSYRIVVSKQPTDPAQVCVPGDGAAGTMPSKDLQAATVRCSTLPTFPVAGTVLGLLGSGLQLSLNGGQALTVSTTNPPSGEVAFAFPTALAPGQVYDVQIVSLPTFPTQTCQVVGGQGTMGPGSPEGLTVACAPVLSTKTYKVGGSVSGLKGGLLRLSLSGGAQKLDVEGNGSFAFQAPVSDKFEYAVTVDAHPTKPIQRCVVRNGKGMVDGADVDDVEVICTEATHVNVQITGQPGSEGTAVWARLFSTGVDAAKVARQPSGTKIQGGEASFTMRMDVEMRSREKEHPAAMPAGDYLLYVYVNQDGSSDTISGDAIFNEGDLGAVVPVSTRAGKLTVVTVETLSPLVRATVAPSPAPAEGQHLTCLWAPQGVGALDLPANPNVAPVVAVSVQCKDKRPCPSDGQDEKTVDEPVLLGEDIAYDVTCWLDLDGDSAFSEGDKWGHHEVDEVDAAFVLDEVKSAAEDEADTGEGD